MSQYQYYQEQRGFALPRITWAVQRLILANALVFVLQLLAAPAQAALGMFFGGFPINGLELTLSFQPDLFLSGYIYKPLTYQFLHSGLLHLFMNMLWLFFFGPEVERTLGTRQFFRFYLLCGALAVLATIPAYLMPGSRVLAPSVMGASGAVMGVLVAFAMVDPHRQFYLFPLPVPITAVWLVVIVVVMNIVSGLGDNSISVATHFGGMATGYALMKLIPIINARRRQRRAARAVPEAKPNSDKVGEAVDNIFKFEDRNRR